MTAFNTLDTIDVAGKIVLVRVDLNVPMKNGEVTDTTRIDRLAPTVLELSDKGARIVLISHFGRPKGEVKSEYSLLPVLPVLEATLDRPVLFAHDCIGAEAAQIVAKLGDGDICLLENLRFYKGEEKNDDEFATELAKLGDIYVNDAFSVSHRAHASTHALALKLPAAAGRLMQAELEALTKALETPERPVVAVVGGAKISTKLELLSNMIEKVDVLVLGGGMANTFMYAKGIDVGNSLKEADMADQARAIMNKAATIGCEILLPTDVVVAKEFARGAECETVPGDAVPEDSMILDVGPQTVATIATAFAKAKTLVWNGPLGAFEISPFDTATVAAAREAATLTDAGKLLTVAGGGDTVAALALAGVVDRFSYISSAGGAFLEWLEGKDLPGVAVLKRA